MVERLEMKALDQLQEAINEAWIKAYGGVPVDSISALCSRIKTLADDRDCWLSNAKTNQKEYQRLEALLKEKEGSKETKA